MTIQLYKAIENEIKRRIAEGELLPGDKLPAESALMKEFEASKMTIRQCITNLSQEGLIYSIERVGNFIATLEVDKYILHFDELKKIKGVDEVTVIKTHFAKEKEIAENFPDLCGPVRVFVIERLFKSDELPVALDLIQVTYDKETHINDNDLIHRSFIELMSERMTAHSTQNDLTIEALACPAKTAKILGIPDHEPVALITQRFYDANGRMFAFCQTTCRGDYIELSASNFQ